MQVRGCTRVRVCARLFVHACVRVVWAVPQVVAGPMDAASCDVAAAAHAICVCMDMLTDTHVDMCIDIPDATFRLVGP